MYNFDPDETGIHMRDVFKTQSAYNQYMKERKKIADQQKKSTRKPKKTKKK